MEKSSFFNSVQASDGSYDREYLAEDFAKYFASFIGNGVFPNPSTNLQVLSNNDMTVSIDIGKAYINGYYYENTTKLVKTIDIADGVLNRVDLIVLRLDFTNREIKTYVKKGTFASSPKAETLQRDSDIYELGLAEVYVKSGATTITQANITDLRLDSNSCGVVSNLVTTVDATTLYNKYESLFNQKITKNEDDFNAWLEGLKTTLDGDTAGQLMNMIGTLSRLKTSNITSLVDAVNEIYDITINNKSNINKNVDNINKLNINKAEVKMGNNILTGNSIKVTDTFITENTQLIINTDNTEIGLLMWTTSNGEFTITSDEDEENVTFSWTAIKGGEV